MQAIAVCPRHFVDQFLFEQLCRLLIDRLQCRCDSHVTANLMQRFRQIIHRIKHFKERLARLVMTHEAASQIQRIDAMRVLCQQPIALLLNEIHLGR